jgi:membrane-bound serine protease (ClpP class)
MWMALKARLRRPTTGEEGLIGQIGKAKDAFEGEGMVYVAGEYWRAQCAVPVAAGAKVRVVRKEGMTIVVEPVT